MPFIFNLAIYNFQFKNLYFFFVVFVQYNNLYFFVVVPLADVSEILICLYCDLSPGMDRQIGFLRPEVTISLREGSSHELSRCTCGRLALTRRGLGYVGRSRMRNNCIYR